MSESRVTASILLVDDHALMREGLRRMLEEDALVRIVGEATTSAQMIAMIAHHRPDVVLLNLDIPLHNGLDALQLLRTRVSWPLCIILLSAHHREEFVRRAREWRVAGFLDRQCGRRELYHAIALALAGHRAYGKTSDSIAKRQVYNKGGALRRYADGSRPLTAAELTVLLAMIGSESYDDIARRLGRGSSTIRKQAASICLKLDVPNRQMAVLKALHLGILRLDDGLCSAPGAPYWADPLSPALAVEKPRLHRRKMSLEPVERITPHQRARTAESVTS